MKEKAVAHSNLLCSLVPDTDQIRNSAAFKGLSLSCMTDAVFQ